MRTGKVHIEDLYTNISNIKAPKRVSIQPVTGRGPEVKESPSGKTTRKQIILVLVLLLILMLMFLILIILTSLLFTYNSSIIKDLSHLKNNVSNIMGDLSKIKQKVDTTEGSCISCPHGWQLIKAKCYYFQSNATSWLRSKNECAARNSVLLVLKDIFEMNALLPTIGIRKYWIGLKLDTENWVWTDGTPLSFSVWNAGEPNNLSKNEDCAEIIGEVQMWNDRPCDNNLGYICKGVWSC
ncbi:perlucin-like protein [Mixophyes fleayi]|uniref:perlucin-like protein n=1 Tax=Mixophyes fleayi TaxID=3061075 RepID=UPI003F4E0154